MDLSTIVKNLPRYMAAGVCVEIRGKSGIGKTDMIREFVWNMNKTSGKTWGLGSHFFATYTPPDVTGFLMPRTIRITMADGTVQEQTISEWSAPAWLRADPGQQFAWLNEFDVPVLVLEEWDKANPEVKKAGAPILLYGGIGQWFLKPGAGRIILSNHADDGRQGSTKEFDFVINRKFLFHATQTIKGWLAWAERNDIDPMFKAFAEEHPGVVFGGELPKEQGPYPTARSFCMLESVTKQGGMLDENGRLTDPELFAEEAAGIVGGPAARDIVNFFKFRDEVPNWADIVKDPTKAKVPDGAGAQMMAAHICAFNVDGKTIDSAVRYVRRIRKEFHLIFARAATRRDFRLVNSKPFEKWTQEEPALVALINALGGAR